MNRKILQKSKRVLGTCIIILGSLCILYSPAFGEDVTFTMPIDDAKKITVNLEKTNIYEQQIVLLEKANGQLLDQTKILIEQTTILKEQLKIKQDQIDLSAKELENQKKLYEDKLKVCENDKPSFVDKALVFLSGAGVGAIIIGVMIIL